VLDFSGSMHGQRIAALRATFAGLSGTDRSHTGKFFRFYQGERFTVIRFGGRILGERDFTINDERDLAAIQNFIAVDDFDSSTAMGSALDHAYQSAAPGAGPPHVDSIVLMTDGENNAGISLDDFLHRHPTPPGSQTVHTFTIRFGEADPAQLD